jgi:hypothetical protein
MTAEVTILNRSAVALAADSAITVSYWEGGERKTRYFKGTNKIFNISNKFPVGLMIYHAGSIEGMPWEIIANAYRDRRGNDLHEHLADYAKHFFDFIESDNHLFPQDFKESQFVSKMVGVVLRICSVLDRELQEAKREVRTKKGLDLLRNGFDNLRQAIEQDTYLKCPECEYIEKEAQLYRNRVLKEVEKYVLFEVIKDGLDFGEVYKAAASALVKEDWTTLQTTGLVFAGYGENDYFPRIHHCMCYGLLLGRLIVTPVDDEASDVSHHNVSEIIPIAKSDMMDTFICGASIDALVEIDDFFENCIDGLVDAMKKSGTITGDFDYSSEKNAACIDFREKVSEYLAREHTKPLRNVIGMLSVGELAELAETLVSIESLKERVTRPTESVGGPIDVAVISKSDGFIWIKRKHYFDPGLNARFFARQSIPGTEA